MDFVVGLQECDEYESIWVIEDQLSMMRHILPSRTTIDSSGLAELFVNEVVRLHGLPMMIVSDREPQCFLNLLGADM